jgi:hypothetical protein
MRIYFRKLSDDKKELSSEEGKYLEKIKEEYETNGDAVLFARFGTEISFVFPISNGLRFLTIGRIIDEDVDEYETDKDDEELIVFGLAGNSSLY